MAPVLTQLKNYTLYLKHNVNAAAIASLRGEAVNNKAKGMSLGIGPAGASTNPIAEKSKAKPGSISSCLRHRQIDYEHGECQHGDDTERDERSPRGKQFPPGELMQEPADGGIQHQPCGDQQKSSMLQNI
jgi:hypothetical protein